MGLEGIFGAAAIDQGQRVVLVKGGSAGLDGGIDSRQKRDLGDERVTERQFKKLAQEMALCNAMIGLGKALARQFVRESLQCGSIQYCTGMGSGPMTLKI